MFCVDSLDIDVVHTLGSGSRRAAKNTNLRLLLAMAQWDSSETVTQRASRLMAMFSVSTNFIQNRNVLMQVEILQVRNTSVCCSGGTLESDRSDTSERNPIGSKMSNPVWLTQ